MEIKLNLTENEVGFLKQYEELYNSEREIDITAEPIVVVERKEKIYIGDADPCCDYDTVYVLEHDYETEYDTEEEAEEYVEEHNSKSEILKFDVIPTWKPVAYFLTRKEAENYCKYQKHNLGECRVYTRNVGYGNHGDLACLMNLLKSIGKQLLTEAGEVNGSHKR